MLWLITNWKRLITNWKTVLAGVSALAIGLGVGYNIGHWRGFSAGVEHQKTEYLKSEHAALVKSTEKIAETFTEYERIISDIQTTPDPSAAPAALVSTIKRLPDPKSKTAK